MLNKHTTNRMWITIAVIALFVLLPLIFAASQAAATMQTAENKFADFDPDHFSNPTTIDNEYYPLIPGTQFTYEGHTLDDAGDEIPHTVVTTVTDLTKEICGGLTAVVVYEEDLSDGELEESEFYLVGQDNDGNVWRFGEYTEAYDPETGEFLGGKAFLSATWMEHRLALRCLLTHPLTRPNTPKDLHQSRLALLTKAKWLRLMKG